MTHVPVVILATQKKPEDLYQSRQELLNAGFRQSEHFAIFSNPYIALDMLVPKSRQMFVVDGLFRGPVSLTYHMVGHLPVINKSLIVGLVREEDEIVRGNFDFSVVRGGELSEYQSLIPKMHLFFQNAPRTEFSRS